MRYSAVQHRIDLLALEAGESLTQSSGLLVENVASLQGLNDLVHLDVIEVDVLTVIPFTATHTFLFFFLCFCLIMLVIIFFFLLFLFYCTSFFKRGRFAIQLPGRLFAWLLCRLDALLYLPDFVLIFFQFDLDPADLLLSQHPWLLFLSHPVATSFLRQSGFLILRVNAIKIGAVLDKLRGRSLLSDSLLMCPFA